MQRLRQDDWFKFILLIAVIILITVMWTYITLPDDPGLTRIDPEAECYAPGPVSAC